MNRRSFFQLVTGVVGGVVAAFVPKTKPKMTLREWDKTTQMETVIQDERNLMPTLNWIHVGPYKDTSLIQMDCCYTHKNGKKMRCCTLFDIDSIEGDLKNCDADIRRRAIEGGAWYPTEDTEYAIS